MASRLPPLSTNEVNELIESHCRRLEGLSMKKEVWEEPIQLAN